MSGPWRKHLGQRLAHTQAAAWCVYRVPVLLCAEALRVDSFIWLTMGAGVMMDEGSEGLGLAQGYPGGANARTSTMGLLHAIHQ